MNNEFENSEFENSESENNESENNKEAEEFRRLGKESELSLIAEFLVFIRENKAWWMVPILLVLGIVGILIVLSSSGVAPFIYTLF